MPLVPFASMKANGKMKRIRITHRGFRILTLNQKTGIPLDEAARIVEIIEKADSEYFQRKYTNNETGQADSGGKPPHGTA